MPDELTIGELSVRSGVAPSALRFYETRGLIAARRTNGNQRRYDRAVLRRVALIRAGRAAGIRLERIRAALDTLPTTRTPTRRDWERLSRGWRGDLDRQVGTLHAVRDRLTTCIGCGCLSIDRCSLLNPDDEAAEEGPGAHYLLDQANVYPEIEPFDAGMLEVGDGSTLYWEACGNPEGKPAVVLHGGPGSGCATAYRRFFDPSAYRVVLFDQRNCGRSTPHASDPDTDLAGNTTANLVTDIERLRRHLGIERWLVLGGSWGSTLALAYAEAHPATVTAMILFGVTTGRHAEFEWTFRGGVACFFPQQWERLAAWVPPAVEEADIVEAYHRLLNDSDAMVRRRAAEEWCLWESATPAWPPTTGLEERFRDPDYALAFARIVTHYVRHNAWLEDGTLLRGAEALADTPGVLVNGRFDFQAPIANAWKLKSVWPRAELVIVDDAGHGTAGSVGRELVRATDRFAKE